MSFSASSKDIHLEGATLFADCAKADGEEFSSSRLDLDNMIGNIDGNFQWGESSFSQSAQNIRLEGSTLYAELQTPSGNWQDASVNLDEHIGNMDGELTYEP